VLVSSIGKHTVWSPFSFMTALFESLSCWSFVTSFPIDPDLFALYQVGKPILDSIIKLTLSSKSFYSRNLTMNLDPTRWTPPTGWTTSHCPLYPKCDLFYWPSRNHLGPQHPQSRQEGGAQLSLQCQAWHQATIAKIFPKLKVPLTEALLFNVPAMYCHDPSGSIQEHSPITELPYFVIDTLWVTSRQSLTQYPIAVKNMHK